LGTLQVHTITPALPEETVMTSSVTVAMLDDATSPQAPLKQTLFSSRPLTRLKSQQTPKGEVPDLLREVHHIL
jgi:hypothetical protein